jgi:predicted lipoprotein with Yx(FWY)xxD motif
MPARPHLAAAWLACAAAVAVVGCGASHPAAAGSPAYQLRASTVTGAGRVLADGHGYTLYLYVPDHRGRSRCYGACARAWPPLTLPAGVHRPVAGAGVRAALLGTVRRADGARQVTYNGWPLYLYERDHEPGQVTGQAEDMGLWYLISASGTVDKRPVAGAAAG